MPDPSRLAPMQPPFEAFRPEDPLDLQSELRVFREASEVSNSDVMSINRNQPRVPALSLSGLFLPTTRIVSEETETLCEIRLGRITYPLRSPVVGEYQIGRQGIAFRIDSFLPAVVGEGKDRRSALRDFQCRVHVRLHRLLATFEGAWTEEERRDWEILESHLDLDAYLRNRPIKLYQRGEMIKAEGDRWEVRWIDGRKETLDLEKMPDDFAAFEPGEHFEAYVAIHSGTKALIEMYSVHPVEPPDESVSAEDAWQHAIETAERVRLPHSRLDWTK
jgi:hypothetical protein